MMEAKMQHSESIPSAQVSPASAHGLEQYLQPALQFAARAWSSPEDTAKLAWQDACIASELRRTCAAAIVCQTALAFGTSSTKQDRSQNKTKNGDIARNKALNVHDQAARISNTSGAAPWDTDAGQHIVPWQPAMQPLSELHNAESNIDPWDHASSAALPCDVRTGMSPMTAPKKWPYQLAGSRTSFVDSWLMQNRALVARLQ